MEAKKLIEYLQTFDERQQVVFIVANPKDRKRYPVNEMGCITDMGQPVIILGVAGEEELDEDMGGTEEDEHEVCDA